MPVLIPSVSAAYAAVLGLLACLLTVRVILGRVRTNIQAGDGGDAPLAQCIRAHANLAEQAPLALLLVVLVEITGAPAGVVHGLGAALVIARLASAWGLSRSLGQTPQRQAGAGLTVLVMAVSSLLLLYHVLAAH
ncbi:MAG: MAPEG family protein [Burkholderiales bacterium]|nr:MAPEG family protein [Burkholderiales bacterium]